MGVGLALSIIFACATVQEPGETYMVDPGHELASHFTVDSARSANQRVFTVTVSDSLPIGYQPTAYVKVRGATGYSQESLRVEGGWRFEVSERADRAWGALLTVYVPTTPDASRVSDAYHLALAGFVDLDKDEQAQVRRAKADVIDYIDQSDVIADGVAWRRRFSDFPAVWYSSARPESQGWAVFVDGTSTPLPMMPPN